MTSVGDDVERPADDDASGGPEANGRLRPIVGLPVSVRARIVEWAADVAGGAAPRDLSPALQKVARFAPAKRAQRAATVLADAVQHDDRFRAMVAEHAAKLVVDGHPAADRPAAAARAVLLGSPDVDDLLAKVDAAQDQADARARVGELERELRIMTARLARLQEELDAKAATPPIDPGAEAERLRKRLREQGTRLRELQDRLAAERADAAAQREASAAELDRIRAAARTWQQRAEAATGRADAASENIRRLRETSDDRRAADDRRLDLLLGALESAAFGLRREWNLIGGGPAPADRIAAGLRAPAAAERTTDPARLTLWAGLPGAHLIVDGYNVTKTGFPELVLADQRERLVRHLAAFGARTSAEVTVVFDGAAVATSRPIARGVRVLFSPPGVQADDVIADLVRAEPIGRIVIVVSTDRRVADDAVDAGARSTPSAVLLTAIGGTATGG
jgi:predicted RNA-binding protein with PIN domain